MKREMAAANRGDREILKQEMATAILAHYEKIEEEITTTNRADGEKLMREMATALLAHHAKFRGEGSNCHPCSLREDNGGDGKTNRTDHEKLKEDLAAANLTDLQRIKEEVAEDNTQVLQKVAALVMQMFDNEDVLYEKILTDVATTNTQAHEGAKACRWRYWRVCLWRCARRRNSWPG